MKKTEGFTLSDGDDYFDRALAPKGYVLLWRRAPYSYCAMNTSKRTVITFCEGDLFKEEYDTQAEFLAGLQELKTWWLQDLGDHADMCLAGCAEKYGFLKTDAISVV